MRACLLFTVLDLEAEWLSQSFQGGRMVGNADEVLWWTRARVGYTPCQGSSS